jgi:transcriptional antiterminator RfaH
VPILKREPDLYPDDLLTAPVPDAAAAAGTAGWWVAHTRSRQEKVLARHLRARAVGHYLPQREQLLTAGGRKRVSYRPLFPGYVFFRGGGSERLAAFGSGVVVRLLPVPDQLGLEDELRSLWRLQATGAPLVPWRYLGPGDEVEIVDGPLRGWTGTVLRTKGALRLVVSVTLLRQSVAAEVDRELVSPLVRRGGYNRPAAARL